MRKCFVTRKKVFKKLNGYLQYKKSYFNAAQKMVADDRGWVHIIRIRPFMQKWEKETLTT